MNNGQHLSLRVGVLWHACAEDRAIDTIYDELDEACLAGRHDFVREALTALVEDGHGIVILLSALKITFPFRSESNFERTRASNRVRYLAGGRASAMLAGLDT